MTWRAWGRSSGRGSWPHIERLPPVQALQKDTHPGERAENHDPHHPQVCTLSDKCRAHSSWGGRAGKAPARVTALSLLVPGMLGTLLLCFHSNPKGRRMYPTYVPVQLGVCG